MYVPCALIKIRHRNSSLSIESLFFSRQNVVVNCNYNCGHNNNRVRRCCTRSIRQVCARTVIGTRLRCRANRKESLLPLSNAGLPTVTWHYRVLTVRHTSPSPNDDVYKVVSTTVGNDVRPPWPASIGARPAGGPAPATYHPVTLH